MNINELVQKQFKKMIVGIEAGEFLFEQPDALKVINKLERLQAIILGLDFWKKYGDGDVREVNSTNWASINKGPEASKNTIEAARELIGHGLPDDADYVSFVLRDQEVTHKG